MPRVRITVNNPPRNWLTQLSNSHPDDEFRVLAAYSSEDDTVGILEVHTRNPDSVLNQLCEADGLHSFERMDADDDALLIEYHTPEPEIQALVFKSGVVPHYPIVYRDGTVTVTRAISHEQLADLTEAFEDAGVDYDIGFLVQNLCSESILTDRQRQFIDEAVNQGYYESPRRCSLTELAAEMDVHKTTASDILHRAERRIITEFVATQS
jgi:predicted DNA binding protein